MPAAAPRLAPMLCSLRGPTDTQLLLRCLCSATPPPTQTCVFILHTPPCSRPSNYAHQQPCSPPRSRAQCQHNQVHAVPVTCAVTVWSAHSCTVGPRLKAPSFQPVAADAARAARAPLASSRAPPPHPGRCAERIGRMVGSGSGLGRRAHTRAAACVAAWPAMVEATSCLSRRSPPPPRNAPYTALSVQNDHSDSSVHTAPPTR